MLEGARGGRLKALWAERCVVGCKNMSPAQPVVKPGTTALWSHCPDPGWLLPTPRTTVQLGQAGKWGWMHAHLHSAGGTHPPRQHRSPSLSITPTS